MIVHLDPKHVVAAKHEQSGAWLIGFLFSGREAGEGAMSAVADLYNATARCVQRREEQGSERE